MKKGDATMGIVKVTNKVFGIAVENITVPGGPITQKYAEGDLSSVNFSKLERDERSL
jgi:hypothetical protein